MKLLKIVIVALLCIAANAAVMAGVVQVNVAVPGTLETTVGKINPYHIEALDLSGRLNAADLMFLAKMAGRDHVGNRATEGRLRKLDMRSATIEPGRVEVEGHSFTIPDSAFLMGGLFSGTRLEEVVLPRTASKVSGFMFMNSPLRCVVLPDNAELSDSAFVRCPNLTQVVFPGMTRFVGTGCFYGCNALRTVSMRNVGYVASGAFAGMPELATVSVEGGLGHIDGWAFVGLPQLRSIVLKGDLLSTGGPDIAQDCPLLSSVKFDGIGVEGYFSAATGCPLLGGNMGKGMFMFASDSAYWKGANKKVDTLAPQQQKRFAVRMNALLAQPWLASVPFVGNTLYNAACFFSLCGDKPMAVRLLAKAIDCGYANYYGTLSDSDFGNIRDSKEFGECLSRLREVADYVYLLQKSAPYAADSVFAGKRFTYALPTDSSMVRVREYFKLDSIAGGGNEITRMKRVMTWLHNAIRHDGQYGIPDVGRNSIALYEACKDGKRGLNCRGLAIMLSEMYMAMGWPSRFLTCEPKAYDTDTDCHVINMVWSSELGKWVWMDPTFNAYVADENGTLLHPGEVRQRIAEGLPLVLNDDANWNNRQKQTKEQYLDVYMAKNLYIMSAYIDSGFGVEGSGASEYATLAPAGFRSKYHKCTSDYDWFWQSPRQ